MPTTHHIADAPPVPARLFEVLPEALAAPLAYYDKPVERGLFVLGALPVLASLVSPGVYIDTRDGHVSPDFYVCAVAPPGRGKGALSDAERWAAVADRNVRERAQDELDHYEAMNSKDQKSSERPTYRSHLIPANCSAAVFTKSLEASRSGLIFESEIDTLSNTAQQEWGDFSDVLRKAFHHERVEVRRANDRLIIERPRLSMVISGTPAQFKRLFVSGENGLFSRFCFFAFEDEVDWMGQEARPETQAIRTYGRDMARDLADLYGSMERRTSPMEVRHPDLYWKAHREMFTAATKAAVAMQAPDEFIASIRRAGLVATRAAATLAAFRAWDESGRGEALQFARRVDSSLADCEAGLIIGEIALHHGLRMLCLLSGRDVPGEEKRPGPAYDLLPDPFGRKDLIHAAEALNTSERTLRRERAEWMENGYCEADPVAGIGFYAKRDPVSIGGFALPKAPRLASGAEKPPPALPAERSPPVQRPPTRRADPSAHLPPHLHDAPPPLTDNDIPF